MLRIAFHIKAGDARQNITFASLCFPIAINVKLAHCAFSATFPFSFMLGAMNNITLAIRSNISGSIRMFSFVLVNGTVDVALLNDIDYWKFISFEPSVIELIYAIFVNNLIIDENGKVNDGMAKTRAAQYIRQYVDKKYIPEPSFSENEMELYL